MRPIFQQWYRRHKVLCWVSAGIFTLYTLTGFVIAPLIVDHILRNKVAERIDRRIEVQSVRTNPFAFSLRFKALSVSDRNDGPFVQVGDMYVNVDPLFSLFKWGVVIKSVEIGDPRVSIARFTDGRFNFSDMIPPEGTNSENADANPTKPIRWVLTAFKLTGGQIRFSDALQSQPFESTLSELDIRIDRLDTDPEAVAAAYQMRVRSEMDERVAISGTVDLFPLEISTDLRLDDLAIAKYAVYFRERVRAAVGDGRIGVQAALTWSGKAKSLDDMRFTLSNLKLASNQGQPLVAVPQFAVTGASIDFDRRSVQLGRITTRDGQVDVGIDPGGQMNLAAAFAPPAGDPPAQAAPESPTSDGAAWEVRVPEFALENYTVRYQDQQTEPAAGMTVQQLGVNAAGLSNQKDQLGKVQIQFGWADQGNVVLGGRVGLVPLKAEMAVQVQGLDVRPVQPYLDRHLQLVVTKGFLDSKGDLQIEARNAEAPEVHYTGQVALNQFKSVDRLTTSDFLNWKSLYLNGVDFALEPFKLMVNEVALTDFYNRLTINKDGSSNLAMVMGGEKPVQPQQGGASPTPPAAKESGAKRVESEIKVATVTLQGGRVDFNDFFVKPNVQLPMAQIGGRVSGLDAISTHKADVLLKGMVGGKVPMEIKGKINPLIEKPFVDITIGLKGVELSPFTPYSGKYLGYKLDKGHLSLDLTYRVADNKLDGRNKVVLNQLTLGETVESPEATKLPVKLALALLKDRNGTIDLDLPVSGDLDDPEVSIGGIVAKMFVNLIVGVVTSPFKALGAIFGGGEELAYFDFESGESRIPDGKSEKLDTLAKILYERPGLRLEIQGQVQPEGDIDGLRRLRFETQLKAAKLKKTVARGKKAVPLEQIELTREEREDYVKNAYAVATFPKPRDEKGALKKLTPAEMEKLLYTAIEITPDDLRLLAHQRASAAKDYLVHQGKVEVGRIFIVEPEVESDDAEQMQRRVKFNLI